MGLLSLMLRWQSVTVRDIAMPTVRDIAMPTVESVAVPLPPDPVYPFNREVNIHQLAIYRLQMVFSDSLGGKPTRIHIPHSAATLSQSHEEGIVPQECEEGLTAT